MTITADRMWRPPVTVDCTWCDSQFLSRGRRMQSVHCPRCKHSVRVKRPADPADLVSLPVYDDDEIVDAELCDDDAPAAPSMVTQLARILAAPRAWPSPARALPAPRPHTARPAPRALRPGAELAARNWRFGPAAPGCCEITEVNPHGWPGSAPWHCPAPASGTFDGGRCCDLHLGALTTQVRTR
jgi:hypothetical protein